MYAPTDDDSLPHQVRISMRDRLLSVEKLARIVAVNQIMLAMAVLERQCYTTKAPGTQLRIPTAA